MSGSDYCSGKEDTFYVNGRNVQPFGDHGEKKEDQSCNDEMKD